MNNSYLSLDLFTQVNADFEKRQYLILAGLKKIEDQFYLNKIYPHLTELVELFKTLKEIKQKLEDLREEFPKRIKNVDLVNKKIEFEIVFVEGSDIGLVEDLIEWVLPHMERLLHTGITIHEFVENDLSVEHVGIVPNYRDEGYFFLPDRKNDKLKLFQFELSIFKSAEDKYRSLKTLYVKSIKIGSARLSPNSIKLDLIKEKGDLPNPATFNFDTNLDYPFRETIFPVAKRKLMQVIYDD